MKRAKKGLAALLSVCMLLSLLPVTAFAEETPAADTLEEAAPAPMEEKGAYDALMQAIDQQGPDMFGVREETREPKELFAAARNTYQSGEAQRVPVTFYAMLRPGEPARVGVEDRSPPKFHLKISRWSSLNRFCG